MNNPQKLRDYSNHRHTSLLTFKYTVLTPLGAPAAAPNKVISLVGTLHELNELLHLAPGLSYDRVRRELVKDSVSTSVVTVSNYGGKKEAQKLIIIISPAV